MSKIENKSFPAFPTPIYIGLTKREIISMAALHGLLAGRLDKDVSYDQLVFASVRSADLLLAELEKKP